MTNCCRFARRRPATVATLIADVPELGKLPRREISALIAFYDRLVLAGKPKKTVLAGANSSPFNAMVRSGKSWDNSLHLA